jgi:hypothetical protein
MSRGCRISGSRSSAWNPSNKNYLLSGSILFIRFILFIPSSPSAPTAGSRREDIRQDKQDGQDARSANRRVMIRFRLLLADAPPAKSSRAGALA